MTLSCKCVFCEPEYNTRWKCKNEMYQPIVICIVFMVTPGVMVIKISKLAHFFCISCWMQQKIGHSLGKMFKYILKILFRFFRKCYGLLRSELSLAWFQPLKIQGFGIFLLTQLGFFIRPLCKLYPLVHFIFVSQDHQFDVNLTTVQWAIYLRCSKIWLLMLFNPFVLNAPLRFSDVFRG